MINVFVMHFCDVLLICSCMVNRHKLANARLIDSDLLSLIFLFFFMYRDELGRFVADKRCLMSLKMEGCSNLGGFVLSSSSLSTIWLSNLYSLSKTVTFYQVPFMFLSLTFLGYLSEFVFFTCLFCRFLTVPI